MKKQQVIIEMKEKQTFSKKTAEYQIIFCLEVNQQLTIEVKNQDNQNQYQAEYAYDSLSEKIKMMFDNIKQVYEALISSNLKIQNKSLKLQCPVGKVQKEFQFPLTPITSIQRINILKSKVQQSKIQIMNTNQKLYQKQKELQKIKQDFLQLNDKLKKSTQKQSQELKKSLQELKLKSNRVNQLQKKIDWLKKGYCYVCMDKIGVRFLILRKDFRDKYKYDNKTWHFNQYNYSQQKVIQKKCCSQQCYKSYENSKNGQTLLDRIIKDLQL